MVQQAEAPFTINGSVQGEALRNVVAVMLYCLNKEGLFWLSKIKLQII